MLEWIYSTTTAIGYPGIVLLMFAENICPPLPSELIMPLAGFAAAQGNLSFVGVVLAGSFGALLGQLPYYALGYWVGEEKLFLWADRYGRWLLLSSTDLRRADHWFDRYGRWAVFFGRLVPGLRMLIPLPAGLSRMPVTIFLVFSLFGTVAWTSLLVLLGFVFTAELPSGRPLHRCSDALGRRVCAVSRARLVFKKVLAAPRLQVVCRDK